MNGPARRHDVLVLGEPLLERHVDADGGPSAPDAVSGDAFNAACAAALAGARVGLLTALGDDAGGDRVLAELTHRGIGVELVRRAPRPTGAYTIHPGPPGEGGPVFSYQRTGSAAAALGPALPEVWRAAIAATPVLLTGGIIAALTPDTELLTRAAVRVAREAGVAVCFDVNFRPRLTGPGDALRVLRAVAPDCTVIKIGSPGDSGPLLGLTDPAEVAAAVGGLTGGAPDGAVIVTAGERPLVSATAAGYRSHAVPPSPAFLDPTGAGDVLIGTLAARLALGDRLPTALPEAMAAAALSTAHRGGAPHATRAEVLALARRPDQPVDQR